MNMHFHSVTFNAVFTERFTEYIICESINVMKEKITIKKLLLLPQSLDG